MPGKRTSYSKNQLPLTSNPNRNLDPLKKKKVKLDTKDQKKLTNLLKRTK